MDNTITILGLDPGTATTGFGVIAWDGQSAALEQTGVIRTTNTDTVGRRLIAIRDAFDDLCTTWNPDRVAVEQVFFSKNVTSAMAVAQARGVILAQASAHGIAISEFTPNEIKMALTGYGNASKQQVQAMVQRILALKEPPTPNDAADALAAALCCAHSL